MQQFQPLPSFDEGGIAGTRDTQAQSSTQELKLTGPLLLLNGKQPLLHTDQLSSITRTTEDLKPGTISLTSALQATMGTKTIGRIVVIPGARTRKRLAQSAQATHRRMSTRVKHGIVLAVVALMFITTLFTLTPLATGQSPAQIFSTLGNLISTGQLTSLIPAHEMPTNAGAQSTTPNNPTPPPMTLPKSQYIAIAQQDAIDAGIPADYFVRQINKESGFNPNAVSPAGAEGIAQFEPGTAAGLGINPWDPIQALRAAAHLMANYYHQYGNDYAKALAAYNGGPGTVQYAVNTCGAANWLNCLPGETRAYIYAIMGI
ncbi:MAG TPA: transglycosylase SLT domain-containing protein [Ktedonobacteraceae bacterium]|nr:transglycosylase SLT domain-containing protein [Ktedonobacteraceae bacterium]